MRNASTFALLLAFLTSLALPICAAAQDKPRVDIGILRDGPVHPGDDLTPGLIREIHALLDDEFDVRIEEHVRTADWTALGVMREIDEFLEDDEIDLVISFGALSSQLFCCRTNLPKPVIAPIIIDAELQELPFENGHSGVDNLSYINFPDTFGSDLRQFREITRYRHLAVLVGSWFQDNIEGVALRLAEKGRELGVQLTILSVDDSIDEALARLPEDVDATYIAPLFHLPNSERLRLFESLIERRLPSFSIFGELDVERGALAGQRDNSFYNRLLRRIALNTQRILLGENAADLPVAISDRHQLTINMETVRRTGVYPPWDVLAEAELLHEDPDYARVLSLYDTVDEAIAANLDLLVRRRRVAAADQAVETAKSRFRPQVEVGMTAVQIDDDRVSALSPTGETTLSADLSVVQLLYSERANADLAVQRELQLGREAEIEQLRLDIARDAAVAYFGVLRSDTFERIRKSDLRLTRSNLEAARVRQALGTAGPGETYRWESRLAVARRDLVDARTARLQTREALNRLLNRPLTEGYKILDVGLDDPELITSKERIYQYSASPLHSEVFSQYAVEYGLGRAPEMMQIDTAVAAQERALQSARRAFTRPEVALQGSLEHVVEAWDTAPPAAIPLPTSDETSWSLALRGSLSLFEGGARRAATIEAEEVLAQLKLERASIALRIEQGIRALTHQTRGSYTGLELSQEAADAARKGLDVVRDAYARGAVDILDLLDAQSTALNADLAAADALYQFLIDLIEVQRAICRLDFFTEPGDDEIWFAEIEAYFEKVGVEPFRFDDDRPNRLAPND